MSVEPEPAEEAQPERLTGPREALRVATQRNFGPYFLGNALSASGTWFQNLAASLLVFRLTHSPFLLGVLNFAPRDLGSAISLNSMTFNIARALGPTLAAATVAAFGIPTAFLVNAASYLVFVGCLLVVDPRPQTRQRHARLSESLRLLRAQPRL